jgi:hypothetical protein
MTDKHPMTAPQDAARVWSGYGRTLRCLVPPLIVLTVIAGIATAGMGESRAGPAATCGLGIAVQDPDIRASLVRFDRQQSAAAHKVCDLYRRRH